MREMAVLRGFSTGGEVFYSFFAFFIFFLWFLISQIFLQNFPYFSSLIALFPAFQNRKENPPAS
ncbi:hypothetical protein [Anaerostipes butyraticus]|uniref:hypothetical protein n=1 Tax=Anaerostipes butyraticus TaxID=645466 RepID=UPI001914DC5E|nr:hypothetical protein [Anaerostipes butyraticus]